MELSEFAVGGKTGSAESDKWLVDWLTNSPVAGGMVSIVEDWRASPTSSFLSAKGMPAFFCGQEVYYLMREHDPGRFPYWRRVFANAVPTFGGQK